MTVFTGSYDVIDEVLVGGSSDDVFNLGRGYVYGGGSEVALGRGGVDTAKFSRNLYEYESAVLYPEEGIVAIKLRAEDDFRFDTFYWEDTYYFLDGIERLEFLDQTIDLVEYVTTDMVISGSQYELDYYSYIQEGYNDYSYEYLESDLESLYYPGFGDAEIYASEDEWSTILLPGDVNDDYDLVNDWTVEVELFPKIDEERDREN